MNLPLFRTATAVFALGACCAAHAVPSGTLDPTFDADGMQTTAFDLAGTLVDTFGNDDDLTALTMAPGGRMYLTGLVRREGADIAIGVTRMRYDGAIDPAFGDGGRVVLDVVQGRNAALATALQQDGKLLVAGWALATGETTNRTLLCRLLPSGTPDSTFGDPETPGCRLFGANQAAHALYVQQDGRIVVAADRKSVGSLLLRLEPDGSDDETFGDNGTALLTGAYADSGLVSIDVAPNGDLIAAGRVRLDPDDEDDVLLFRVDPNGAPNEAFGADGAKVIAINAGSSPGRKDDVATRVHALSDGSLLVTGYVSSDNNPDAGPALSHTLLALKLGPDGELDPSFDGGIRLYDPCATACSSESRDSVVLPDGRIVLAGFTRTPTSESSDFLALQLSPTGDADPGFGNGQGVASVDFALIDEDLSADRAQQVALDGARLVLAGSAVLPPIDPNPWAQTDFAVARLDHGLDTTFFDVSVDIAGNGTSTPPGAQDVTHSDHVEFDLTPAPGEMIVSAEGCGGALYGSVYTTGAIVADCTITVVFGQKPAALFADGFEE
ncbi:hypothetical protein [Chiayiivirga flava]|uniref:Putative delta-60 repeat protein n=1 Tax=Chiayiivirga flava TaxID=659595 RepID=A0A7W8D490_9GAMM|nr:hypothetical protein [Chiayiivirga flava]MBB5207656.1 putative delta-60 repeat protein [Chiayiivirga flava]